jgi:hypothetical protein
MLKIEIETGCAAFCDPYTGEEDSYSEAYELTRILKGICEAIDNGATHGNCIDINGNKVGQWSR